MAGVRLTGRVPTRADLAGGTLDIWPLNMLVNNPVTINVALSAFVEIEIYEAESYRLIEEGHSREWESLDAMRSNGFALYAEVLKLDGSGRPLSIHILQRPPRGSGLGASSALMLLLAALLQKRSGEKMEHDTIVALLRDLEVRVLGYPTGVQDYFPPLLGGGLAIHHDAGGWCLEQLPWIPELKERMTICYTRVEHHSGSVNWEVFKEAVENRSGTLDRLNRIAEISGEVRDAWYRRDIPAMGGLLSQEWKIRKTLHPAVDHGVITRILDAAERAGAYGGKATGAGGGGSLVVLHPESAGECVQRSIEEAGGRLLHCVPVEEGLICQS